MLVTCTHADDAIEILFFENLIDPGLKYLNSAKVCGPLWVHLHYCFSWIKVCFGVKLLITSTCSAHQLDSRWMKPNALQQRSKNCTPALNTTLTASENIF